MPGPIKGGEFELIEAKLILSTGKSVGLKAGTILGLTIKENIFQYSLIGSIAIQDALNLGSFGPIIGQEYLKLKIRTPTIVDKDYIIDFTENALMVTSLKMRQDIGHGVQATILDFVSREFVVNQRSRVRRNLEGSYSTIVEEMLRKDLDSKKRLYLEPSAENKKIIAPNTSPHGIISMASANAVSQKHSDPTYLFFENCHGFNFKTLGHLYSIKPKLIYSHTPQAGTKYLPNGAPDVLKNIQNIESFAITSTPDIIYNNTVGVYSSEMIVHDIVSKSYTKNIYNYTTAFKNERHITDGNKKPYPLVNPLSLTEDKKNISSFPSKQFLLPTTGRTKDTSVEDGNNQYVFDSNTWHKTVQQRNSQLGMMQAGLQVTIKVPGNCILGAGDMVGCNLPYHAAFKTQKNEEFDNIYTGNFLIKALEHNFNFGEGLLSGEHTIEMNLYKDSLQNPLYAPPDNFEPTSDHSKGTVRINWDEDE
jgi:hypothetical protein